MNIGNILKAFLLTLLLPASLSAQQEKIRIACVGNSITYGAGIQNRDENSYPAQLQAYLGERYSVRNFGVSATTLLSKGNYPYTTTGQYEDSKDFGPDIVLIKLGTNDTKPQNWQYKNDFKRDYKTLIDSYRALPSKPRVILMTPVRCFMQDENSINARLVSHDVRSMVEELAWENHLEIINLSNLFGGQWQPSLMPDRLHPSAIGAGMIARKIGNYLNQLPKRCATGNLDFLNNAVPFNFHGYRGYEFIFKGVSCKVVCPNIEAKGKPWVMRSRFWGHEPQTDIELLEHGLHVAYCDVSDLYGSPQAVRRWDDFYRMMTSKGFNRKVVLEAMSRGGLIAYNWAGRNAGKVACIYADAPVMDIKSWPMGKGKSKASKEDIKRLLDAYGLRREEDAVKWRKNPLDLANRIAKAGIPCLHVVGDADSVVPVSENTSPFEKVMLEKGNPITVIHKPGVGHHPHSLEDPAPVAHFILSSLGLYTNECTYAVPGNEYRPGAGWAKGAEWHQVAEDINSTLKGRKLELLLLGNSITQGWGGSRRLVLYKPGKAAMDEAVGKDKWESAGISGDQTQNLLWRIRHDGYNCCHPDNVVIAIGVNNLLSGHNTPEEVAEGIVAVTKAAEVEFPQSKIIVLGLLPAGKEAESPIRKQCDKIHEIIGQHKFTKAQYVNPNGWFISDKGQIKDGLYGGDYIHLTSSGYSVLAKKIADLIRK